jgi:hypothetical protein
MTCLLRLPLFDAVVSAVSRKSYVELTLVSPSRAAQNEPDGF